MCTADLGFTGGKNDIGAGTDIDFIGACTPARMVSLSATTTNILTVLISTHLNEGVTGYLHAPTALTPGPIEQEVV